MKQGMAIVSKRGNVIRLRHIYKIVEESEAAEEVKAAARQRKYERKMARKIMALEEKEYLRKISEYNEAIKKQEKEKQRRRFRRMMKKKDRI